MKSRIGLVLLLALAFTLPVATLMVAAQAGKVSRPQGPCDIYAAAGTPCVTAHSTTRALFAAYTGPLYQITRLSDGKTLDVGVVKAMTSPIPDPGGYADAAAQDAFCATSVCVISRIYDQSGKGNHLYQAPPGTFKGPAKGGFNALPIADMAPITIGGHKAYGVYIIPGMGLRNNDAVGLPINDEPQGIYMVVDGTHYDSGCCFNYGNTSTNSRAVGTGTMDTVYFGTATAWGSGNGPGPWIMSDMEAGLFSGYDAKQNVADPTIDSWRFVTGTVNGGGGNQWEIRGGNAQNGRLTTFYRGVRPGSKERNTYFPMHRKGAVQLGNGGDNGNGSAGTFYEGVMTTGYPSEATTDAVQANITAAKYDVPRLTLSRPITFTQRSTQDITETFTNTTGAPAAGLTLSVSLPKGWAATVSGSTGASKKFADTIAPGASVSATFRVTSSASTSAGYLTGKAEWNNQATGRKQSETTAQRVRNVSPITINEVRLSTSTNSTNQFIELYNASSVPVDISNWTLINTQSQWAPVKAATIPAGIKLASGAYYLLGLSGSGLVTPARKGDATINVRSTTGFEVGQKITIDGETRTIASIGTAASAMTTVFVPASTGPWITIPAGSTTLPVTSAAGFEVGQKIGIDIGGNYEVATVTAVGKAATQTSLSTAVVAGATTIGLADVANISVGDILTVGTGGRKESVTVKAVTPAAASGGAAPAGGGGMGGGMGGRGGTPGTVTLAAPLKNDQIAAVDVSDKGTGISFTPATRFAHVSGDAVQALGGGITLDQPLSKGHEYGAPVLNPLATTVGYQGSPAPNQWYGGPLSTSAGSIALMDASGRVLVDAMVYGSQQTNSGANGTVTSPEIATLEGDQGQGGCQVIVPRASSGDGLSRGRFPDGRDTDSNCADFLLQSSSSLAAAAEVGATTIKVASVADLSAGQKIILDMGANSETVTIATVGTAGASTVGTATTVGATAIPVASAAGFAVGQTITIDSGANRETAVVASITGGGRGGGAGGARGGMGGGGSITVTAPLARAHEVGVQVSGSGITLASALTKAHASGAQVAGSIPTPGAPNLYAKRP